jgi:hypothetical protein
MKTTTSLDGSTAALATTLIRRAREALDVDGVALLRGVVAVDVLDGLRTAVQSNRDAGRPMSRQVLYTHRATPSDRPPLTALMDQWLSPHRFDGAGSTRHAAATMRPLAAEILGEEPVLFQDLLLVKREGQKPFPWHQDFGYWPVDRPLGVVLWVPLQASDGATGGLQFAAGSHRLGPRPVVDLHNGSTQEPDADLAFDEGAWPCSLRPTSPATPWRSRRSPSTRRPRCAARRARGLVVHLPVAPRAVAARERPQPSPLQGSCPTARPSRS